MRNISTKTELSGNDVFLFILISLEKYTVLKTLKDISKKG